MEEQQMGVVTTAIGGSGVSVEIEVPEPATVQVLAEVLHAADVAHQTPEVEAADLEDWLYGVRSEVTQRGLATDPETVIPSGMLPDIVLAVCQA